MKRRVTCASVATIVINGGWVALQAAPQLLEVAGLRRAASGARELHLLKRLLKAGGRSSRVSVYSYTGSTALWWRDLQGKVSRMDNLTVWQIDPQHSQSLASLAARTMQLQVTVQEGTVWLGDGNATVELSPQKLR